MIELSGLRALRARFLVDACSIERYTETSSSDGVSFDWTTIATGVPCEVQPLGTGGTENVVGGVGIAAHNTWTIHLPAGTDVTVKDRLVLGARRFEVQSAQQRTYEVSRDCICRELT